MPGECEKEADGSLGAHRQTHTHAHTAQLTLLYMIELRRMLQYPQTSESSFREQVPLSNFPTSKHQGDLLLQIFT